MSGKTQFEGRTAEEAVARARKALGDSDALRCWKTRRGGVGGFFAREVYVASLTPPPGSEPTPGKGPGTPSGKSSGSRGSRTVSDGSARSGDARAAVQPPRDGPRDPQDHLSGLVESTADQVSLGSLAIPADAFDQVLAEAQAALARLPEVGETSAPDQQSLPPEDDEASNASVADGAQPIDDGEPAPLPHPVDVVTTAAGVKAKTRPKPSPTPKSRPKPKPKSRTMARVAPPTSLVSRAPRSRTQRLPDLRPALRRLGVPSAYLPPGRRPSLDLLAEVMATLPVAAALPLGRGAVLAIVGAGNDLARTVDLVTGELALGRRDVLSFDPSAAGRDGSADDLAPAGSPRPDRQIARRRANGRQSVVAVHTPPGRSLERDTREFLEAIAPDYVLAAVGAGCKRADVEHLIGELPTVDALALWELAGTRTPAELLGVLPIAFVDGEPASSMGWTLFLAGRVVGWHQ